MKFVKIMLCVLALLTVFCIDASAKSDIYEDNLQESGAYELYNSLDEETKEILKELGIGELSVEGIYNISARSVMDSFLNLISGKITAPLKCVAVIAGVLLILAITESFVQNSAGISTANLIGVLLIVTAIASPAIEAIGRASSNILLSSNFMLSFIPVYAILIAVSGNPASAFSFNTLLFAGAQLISQCAEKFLLPMLSIFMGLNIAASVNTNISSSKVASIIKKGVTVSLATAATVFIGFLSAKGNLASAADSVALRGVKAISGSFIPIIGTSLGEAYTSVLGSLSLLKGSVGFFGILAVCAMNIPVIFELLMWYFALQACAVISGILGQDTATKLLECISNAIVIANIIVIFVSVIFIISIGILLKTRAV